MLKELTRSELDSQNVTALPARTEMSLVNANLALPINVALAANVLSDGSTATATAAQGNYVPQGIV